MKNTKLIRGRKRIIRNYERKESSDYIYIKCQRKRLIVLNSNQIMTQNIKLLISIKLVG